MVASAMAKNATECDPCQCPNEPHLTVSRLIPGVGSVKDGAWPLIDLAINSIDNMIPIIFNVGELVSHIQTSFFKDGIRTCIGGEAIDVTFNIDDKIYTADMGLIMDVTDTGVFVYACECQQNDGLEHVVNICGSYIRSKIEEKLNEATCIALAYS